MSNLKELIRALETEQAILQTALENLRKLEASRNGRPAPEEKPDWRRTNEAAESAG